MPPKDSQAALIETVPGVSVTGKMTEKASPALQSGRAVSANPNRYKSATASDRRNRRPPECRRDQHPRDLADHAAPSDSAS